MSKRQITSISWSSKNQTITSCSYIMKCSFSIVVYGINISTDTNESANHFSAFFILIKTIIFDQNIMNSRSITMNWCKQKCRLRFVVRSTDISTNFNEVSDHFSASFFGQSKMITYSGFKTIFTWEHYQQQLHAWVVFSLHCP